jgi:hypothetical protein
MPVDATDPVHMRWVSTQMKNDRYLFFSNASDDQAIFFPELIDFIKDVDTAKNYNTSIRCINQCLN